MIIKRLILLAFSFAMVLSPLKAEKPADDATANLLGLSPEWSTLLGQFESTSSLRSTFVEERYRPFRRFPSKFEGTLRIDPNYGISFFYTQPSTALLIFNNRELFRKTGPGQLERIDYLEAVDSMEWLSKVLSWDVSWLKDNITLTGDFTPEFATWSLTLTPNQAGPDFLNNIVLSGSHSEMTNIVLNSGPNKRIVISLIKTDLNPTFSTDEISSFFPLSAE